MLHREELDKLKNKVEEQDKVIETLSETISGYQRYLQASLTDLTRHFMASVEPAIRVLVVSEVKNYLDKIKKV